METPGEKQRTCVSVAPQSQMPSLCDVASAMEEGCGLLADGQTCQQITTRGYAATVRHLSVVAVRW
jgi:hypothetical protein